MNLCLFDLDHTLLPLDSDHAWGEFMIQVGWAPEETFRKKNNEFYRQYQQGRLDLAAYIEFSTRPWRDRASAELRVMQQRFMDEVIGPALVAPVKALIQQHVQQGDVIALVTATNEWVTTPIAQVLGIQHLIAVKLKQSEAGVFTGEIDGVPSFREGKIERVKLWLQAQQLPRLQEFARVSFYSDSMNDLPLLECVTDPVATNPSSELEALALQRNWRILKLFE